MFAAVYKWTICYSHVKLSGLFLYLLHTEYLLQNLGVIPDLKPGEIFTTLDTNYGGLDLPRRYDGIILPADWYVPGKGRRKKRQHRASHRKIR